MNRSLLASEQNVLLRFSERIEDLNIKKQLLLDFRSLFVAETNRDNSIIVFGIEGYERPPYEGQRLVNVEGRAYDKDGAELTVLIYLDQNDRLLQLEIIRWDKNNLISPSWELLELY